MIQLTEKQIAEFHHRCYAAVDGLWFMKVEQEYGFDSALEIDNEVWKVMPKIQARMLKSMGKMENGIEALCACFTTKLALDGFRFKTEKAEDGRAFRVIISNCPWYDLIVKSNREHFSEKVGTRICNTEYSAWASEFGDNLHCEIQEQICKGSECCIIKFSS